MTGSSVVGGGEVLRWGILGTGKIARIVGAALLESGVGRLAAVGSRDSGRAAGFGDEFGAERSYGSYEEVIADDDVDLIYVATPHPHHLRWAVEAADAGKHILCEKPMGVNRAEAEQIVEAARRNDVFLQEAFAYRCHPQTDRLLEILSSGTIGEIRLIEAAFGYDAGSDPGNYLFVQDLAGGSLLDVGCYTTSMAHLIAPFVSGGESPITVSAGGHLGPTGVDLTTAATLVFKGGLVARLACSIQLNLDSRVRIYGSEGQVTVPSPWLPGRIGSTAEIVLQHGWSEPEVIDIPLEADVYTVEVDVVSRSVLAGERNPDRMKWQESLTNMNTLDRWRETIGLLYSQDSRPFSAGSDAEGE